MSDAPLTHDGSWLAGGQGFMSCLTMDHYAAV